jgi:serine/threonine-protein kinase
LARDVEVAKAVSHPNLAVVLAANLDAAPYYLTMPFLEGGTVRALVDRVAAAPRDVTGRPRFISVARCLWIARQTAEGLAQLHQSGWIHGDIKPTNLQVSPHGQTTILDFGLARRKETAECVSSDTWAGTVGYAAPETYLTHHTLTTAADIYSLGMVLYELLVGEPAFSEVDERRLIAAHLEQPLPDVLARRREIPPRLAHLLRRMTAKEPLRRPADDELLQELVALEVAALHAAA